MRLYSQSVIADKQDISLSAITHCCNQTYAFDFDYHGSPVTTFTTLEDASQTELLYFSRFLLLQQFMWRTEEQGFWQMSSCYFPLVIDFVHRVGFLVYSCEINLKTPEISTKLAAWVERERDRAICNVTCSASCRNGNASSRWRAEPGCRWVGWELLRRLLLCGASLEVWSELLIAGELCCWLKANCCCLMSSRDRLGVNWSGISLLLICSFWPIVVRRRQTARVQLRQWGGAVGSVTWCVVESWRMARTTMAKNGSL